ncbi:MAG: Ig-like domain-containing protein [Candidatus Thorarchaeota archaeon]
MDYRKVIIGVFIAILLTSVIVVIFISLPRTPPTNGNNTDTTPPVIAITGPLDNAVVYGAEAITFTATDNSSIQRYEIYIDGVITAVGQSYNWNTILVSDGQHNITCRARDEHSNWGQDTINVIVNNTVTFTSADFDPIFKAMTYNIQESGINPDWKEVVKEENPDILILVETGFWDDDGSKGLRNVVSEFNEYFVNEDPYDGFCAQGIAFSTSGEAVLSRFPVVYFRQIQNVYLDDATGYDVTHDFIDAVININGTEVHFVGCHLKAGGTAIDGDRREWENEGIINYFDSLGDVPLVYLGDLNSYSPVDNGTLAPNSSEAGVGPMTMLIEPDNPTYGQYSSEMHNFTDVFRDLNPTEPGYTFGHQFSPLLGRIDYIITNQFFDDALINSTAGDTPHAFTGSDHYDVDAFINWTTVANVTALKADRKISTIISSLPSGLRDYNPNPSIDECRISEPVREPVSWCQLLNYRILVKDQT